MKVQCKHTALSVVILGILMLTGCGTTQPARFYTLSSLAEAPQSSSATEQQRDITIGIGPINLARYLDRPQIVTRVGPNRFDIAEFNRWGGSLRDDFEHVLADDLSVLISTEQVLVHPWRRTNKIHYQVMAEVNQLDGELGKESVLNVFWQVLTDNGRTVAVARRSEFREPTGGGGYEKLVAAQSRSVADLSRQIAATIKRLEQETQSSSQE